MILKSIDILNYKNIREARLEFSENINCFIGNNGEGKTNMLDAIYYLSFCHSMFSNIDSQIIRHGEEFFMIQGQYFPEAQGLELTSGSELTAQGSQPSLEEIYAGMKRGVKKQFKRNKKNYKKLSEHIGLIPLIIVSPDDVSLILGGSEERRKFLDIVISQYDNTYIDSLNRYNKALQQRNALLKMEQEPDPMLLSLWEEEMAREGETIYQKRNDFVERFIPVFKEIYRSISDEKENVSLRYISHCQRGPLLQVIQNGRVADRAVGHSLHGIHRDDLEMLIGGYPMKREGSQGQNKTYVISLKLAQFDFLKSVKQSDSLPMVEGVNRGSTPLLLLDDIFDKLDSERVEKIVQMVSGDNFGQIFITDTNRDHLDKILSNSNSDYRIFHVRQGQFE